jgi:hypothetical protein
MVQTLLNSPFGCSFKFSIRPAGWPVGRWGWQLPGITPIQVQLEASNLTGISLRAYHSSYHPLRACSALAPRAGGRTTGSAGGRWRLHPASGGCCSPVRQNGGGAASVQVSVAASSSDVVLVSAWSSNLRLMTLVFISSSVGCVSSSSVVPVSFGP